MLVQLTVKNFALIEEARLEFASGLNAMTGETGAGKSILLNALRMVLGERFDSSFLRDEGGPCWIEAVFEPSPEMCRRIAERLEDFLSPEDQYLILRREISSEGRSRQYVNGQIVNVSLLREIGRMMTDFHGQFDAQGIFERETHRILIDQMAGLHAKEDGLLASYRSDYDAWRECQARKDELLKACEGRQRELDLLSYQIREIEEIDPEEGEEHELEVERIRLAHSQKLYELTERILQALDEDEGAASSRLIEGFREFAAWEKIDGTAGSIREGLENIQLGLEETVRSIRDYQETLSFDGERLTEIEDRLERLRLLTRKYGKDVTEIVAFLEEARRRYDELDNADVTAADLDRRMAELESTLDKQAARITRKRSQAAGQLTEGVQLELRELGIRHARFSCSIMRDEYGPHGRDAVEFMLSANAGEEMKPLARIASGGEASRVILALKRGLMKVDPIPTLVFDEIDANIGGRLGSVVGSKLREIAGERQILVITHLPQIASFAETHFQVRKRAEEGRTVVDYVSLEGEERVRELAQMMSGDKETQISRKHALEMLKAARV